MNYAMRKRNPENEGLPKRWRKRGHSYYYCVPPGQENKWEGKQTFKLGKSLSEAYTEWAKRIEGKHKATTINELLDRYLGEVVPTKAVSTQFHNGRYAKKLRIVFGHMNIEDIRTCDIYGYLDRRSQKQEDGTGGITAANREIAMFRSVYTKAVKWGYIENHPFKGEIEFESEKGRDRYIENWELDEFLSIKPKHKSDTARIIQAYVNLKVITGLRQQDMLRMKVTDFTEEGIEVDIRKTGDRILIKWTPALRQAVDNALSVRPVDISPFVFCTRRGVSYYKEGKAQPSSAFKSLWQRYMKRALEQTNLKESFTEHDLRAKTASDLDNIEHARKLLSHSDSRMTQKYIRKRQIVEPAK